MSELPDRDTLLSIGGELLEDTSQRDHPVAAFFLVELHHCRRGHKTLGQRRHVEDGVLRHRFNLRLQSAISVRLLEDSPAVVINENDRPG